jgi:antitoxin (DNA-binding transcriptional repressor) of toxin-antitoxin stability system
MKKLPVAEVRSHFSALLKEVEEGHEIGIAYGRKRKVIAVIVPYDEYSKGKKKELGGLAGKAHVDFHGSWAISDEELMQA